jgi:hypothetical protein
MVKAGSKTLLKKLFVRFQGLMLMFVFWSSGFRSRLSFSILKMEAVPISKGQWHQGTKESF